VLVWGGQQHGALAQAKPESPAQNPPTAEQPAVQPPSTAEPPPAKPPTEPSNPAEEAKGGASGKLGIPAPTVQLKPGEVPGIKLDAADYDFGRATVGQQVSHDFWFTNTGNGPLEILSVKPSCGCTVTGQYDRIVQPKETGKIPTTLSVGMHGGRINKAITVYTNAPGDGATVKLSLQGEVWSPVEVEPPSATFGRLTPEEAKDPTRAQKVSITNQLAERPLELKDIHSSSPAFKAELAVIEPGQKFELRVSVASTLKPGSNSGTINLTTGLKDMPSLSIPVNVFVAPDIEITPTSLALSAGIPTDVKRQFSIKNNTEGPIQLSGVEVSNPSLKTTLDEMLAGRTYRLSVEVPAGFKLSPGGDKITIKTNSSRVPVLTVPIVQLPNTPAAAPAAATSQRSTSGPATGKTPAANPLRGATP